MASYRRPVHAGSWYSGDAAHLTASIDSWLQQAPDSLPNVTPATHILAPVPPTPTKRWICRDGAYGRQAEHIQDLCYSRKDIVAQKFVTDHELPIAYIDQVTQFIITNTHGTSLDSTAAQEQGVQNPRKEPTILPQKTFLSIKEANLKVIYKKTKEVNAKLESEGHEDITLNPSELEILGGLIEELEKPGPLAATRGLDEGLQLVARIATRWPVPNRIPGLDLFRILAAATSTIAETTYSGMDLITLLIESKVFDAEDLKINNAMLAVRTITNLFEHKAGQDLVIGHLKELTPLIDTLCLTCLKNKISNRNLIIALATLYINLAVYEANKAPVEETEVTAQHKLTYMKAMNMILTSEKDSEAVYRALIAIGTIIVSSEHTVMLSAKSTLDIPAALKKVLASDAGREPRIQAVIKEINAKME
ncbi:hypothetical protein KEM56_006797 [Ascosphaera pollenicola]|nr:hypothetical protein KEM56_006797 [Ascosphaera pollenicola]